MFRKLKMKNKLMEINLDSLIIFLCLTKLKKEMVNKWIIRMKKKMVLQYQK